MSKGWVDAGLLIDNTEELDYKLKPYKYMMQEVPRPNIEKHYNNAHRVYEKNEFIILKVYSGNNTGFIAYNTKKKWECGHTHLNDFNMAKTVISNVIQRRKPKTNNIYLMKSHIRISDDDSYKNFIEELIRNRRNIKR